MSKSNPHRGVAKPRACQQKIDQTNDRSRLAHLAALMKVHAQREARSPRATAAMGIPDQQTSPAQLPLAARDLLRAPSVATPKWEVRPFNPWMPTPAIVPSSSFPPSLPEQVVSDGGPEWQASRIWPRPDKRAAEMANRRALELMNRRDFERALHAIRLRAWMNEVMRESFVLRTPASSASLPSRQKARPATYFRLRYHPNYAYLDGQLHGRFAGSPLFLTTCHRATLQHILMEHKSGTSSSAQACTGCDRTCVRKPRRR